MTQVDPRRIAVLASGEGTNLQALLETVHGRDGIEIVAFAASRSDAPALERALAAGVECAVFAKADHPDRAARDVALANWLRERGVGLVVLAGWMELLTPGLLAAFPDRVVNVHPSLLPAYPGLDAVGQAIAAGETTLGVTIHLVDEGVDSGRILLQDSIEVPPGTDAATALDLLRPLEHRLLPEAVGKLAVGALS